MVCLLHSACLVVKDSLSIISRIRISFEGESLGAMSPRLIAVSMDSLCRKLQLIMKGREGRAGTVCMPILCKIHRPWY
jgi:hypothetical protein